MRIRSTAALLRGTAVVHTQLGGNIEEHFDRRI